MTRPTISLNRTTDRTCIKSNQLVSCQPHNPEPSLSFSYPSAATRSLLWHASFGVRHDASVTPVTPLLTPWHFSRSHLLRFAVFYVTEYLRFWGDTMEKIFENLHTCCSSSTVVKLLRNPYTPYNLKGAISRNKGWDTSSLKHISNKRATIQTT